MGGQLTVREVNEAMQTMVDEMRKHGKEFEEKTKVSCVDTIKLRNSKVIQEPPKPKQNRNRRSIDSLAGELRDTSERKGLKKSPSNMVREVFIHKKCGCPPPKKRFTRSMEFLSDWKESSLDGDLHELAKSFSDRLDSDHGVPLNYEEDANLKFYHNSSY